MFSMPFGVRSVRIEKLDTAGNEMREMMSCTEINRWFPTAMRISLTRVVTDLGLSSVKLLSVFVDWDNFPQKVRSFCTLSLTEVVRSPCQRKLVKNLPAKHLFMTNTKSCSSL